jgi:hypothetical protein
MTDRLSGCLLPRSQTRAISPSTPEALFDLTRPLPAVNTVPAEFDPAEVRARVGRLMARGRAGIFESRHPDHPFTSTLR